MWCRRRGGVSPPRCASLLGERSRRQAGLGAREPVAQGVDPPPPGHARRTTMPSVSATCCSATPLTTRSQRQRERGSTNVSRNGSRTTAADLAELDETRRLASRASRAVRGGCWAEGSTPSLASRAVSHLQAAGARARDRGDVAAAKGLFERALSLASAAGTSSAAISVALAECLVEAGEVGRADELLSAMELDGGAGPLAALTRLEWMFRVRPQELVPAVESEASGNSSRAGSGRRREWNGSRALGRVHAALARKPMDAGGSRGRVWPPSTLRRRLMKASARARLPSTSRRSSTARQRCRRSPASSTTSIGASPARASQQG